MTTTFLRGTYCFAFFSSSFVESLGSKLNIYCVTPVMANMYEYIMHLFLVVANVSVLFYMKPRTTNNSFTLPSFFHMCEKKYESNIRNLVSALKLM